MHVGLLIYAALLISSGFILQYFTVSGVITLFAMLLFVGLFALFRQDEIIQLENMSVLINGKKQQSKIKRKSSIFILKKRICTGLP